MFAFLVARGPEESFGGMGEVTAAQVGRGIRLLPGDVVENFVAKLLQRVPDGKNDVMGAAHPNGAVGLQHTLAAPEPFQVKLVVEFGSAGFVPIAFVHLDHAAGVAGDAAVGEEIRRVGKYGVKPAFRIFGGNGVQEREAIRVVQAHERRIVGKDEMRIGRFARS